MKQLLLLLIIAIQYLSAQEIIQVDPSKTFQVIDGFGAFQGGDITLQSWWKNLFVHDLECSIYRVDLTPRLRSPYSDLSYFSPWFMGSQTKSVFNLEDPANPNGPENNRVRTYKGPTDYSRTFGGRNAPIAVMGPNIETNLNYFIYPADGAIQELLSNKKKLGDVKIIGSIWSPLPWVKISSGNSYPENWWPGPVNGARWPFIWGGNFAGGRLDVSGTLYSEFDDASQGGIGNTSALTQFARSSAAYILGYQRNFNFKFYAISIQNELNFEQFYNSATYPLSSQYIIALKAIRSEFNKYPELRDIKIMGPEDLLGGDAYGMWEYGGPVHKNLQYIKNIENDPEGSKALDFYCIHGYANDGISSAGSNPRLWDWWTNGWTTSPAPGIPSNVKGFSSYNKKSWMTETSGEHRDWIYPKSGYPNNGGWSLGLKIHQALTTGMQSAWVHWTFAESNDEGLVSNFGLTNQASGAFSPKYVAVKHFFKFIRPGSKRVQVVSNTNSKVLCSSYINLEDKEISFVLINTSSATQKVTINIPVNNKSIVMDDYLSFENNYFLKSSKEFVNGSINVDMPAYSIRTLNGKYDYLSNIESFTSTDISIQFYENRNILIWNSKSDLDIKNFTLYNLNSQIIYSSDQNDFDNITNTIQLPEIQSGVYFIEIDFKHQKKSFRFIKIQN
ncbi:MAG: T9SS type A sorting domain-containing protein [Saprospiraceae bacterium]|nr:T9SS type A sorting domain-containing protein [Saprospiraceae bacterium]